MIFTPTRRSESEAEVVIGSIAGSAAIWSAFVLFTLLASWLVNTVDVVTRWGRIDLFTWWIKPTLTAKEFGPQSVIPGIALSALSLLAGAVYAGWLRAESGGLKRFDLPVPGVPLSFDPNARVWSSFLQVPDTGRWFRVTLNSGKIVVGQIGKYSTDPNDDLMEIEMVEYAIAETASAELMDPGDSVAMLISRDAIEYIEKLEEVLIAVQSESDDAAPIKTE